MRFLNMLLFLLLASSLSAQQDPCNINNLNVETFDCDTAAGTYSITINFDVTNPGSDTFIVYHADDLIGYYSFNTLPLTLTNFEWNGQLGDFIKVCIADNADCCDIKQYATPSCFTGNDPCEILDLSVQTGACTSDNSYELTINFVAQLPPGLPGVFQLFANGTFFGEYSVGDLPLTISDFPYNGGVNDVVKVCIGGQNLPISCCAEKEFAVPDCLDDNSGQCVIGRLKFEVGDCSSDSTYKLKVNFKVKNAPVDSFGISVDGQFVGKYALSALPLTIDNFPYIGGNFDKITICVGPDCCRTRNVAPPACATGTDCVVYQVIPETGDCTTDSTYQFNVRFKVINPDADSFEVWGNSTYLGKYALDSVNVFTTDSFPSGGGNFDTVRVCVGNTCCKTKIFEAPSCLPIAQCEIYRLEPESGDCNPDGTYNVKLQFKVANPDADSFKVWANDSTYLGQYALADLPVQLSNFPRSGNPFDIVTVCLSSNCCKSKRVTPPTCPPADSCDISDFVVDPGACTPDSSAFSLVVNFTTTAADSFSLYADGGLLVGVFAVADLPVTVDSFPLVSGTTGVAKVCLNSNCCETKEFQQPDCGQGGGGGGGNCEIVDLAVDSVSCNPDGGFDVFLNFALGASTTADSFSVEAGGSLLGNFALTSLPLQIQNFPAPNQGTGKVTVCIVGYDSCCETLEFPAPDCIPDLDSCVISNLQVLTTPCLNNQFFAVLTFDAQGGGIGGFNVFINNELLANFAYDITQPLILGPFTSIPDEEWTFMVQDQLNPDCQAIINIGEVNCDQLRPQQTKSGNGLRMGLSPNPAQDRLNIATLQRDSNRPISGAAKVQVFRADGRLVRMINVEDAGAFSMDVADLLPGMYRVVVLTSEGPTNGTFAKQ